MSSPSPQEDDRAGADASAVDAPTAGAAPVAIGLWVVIAVGLLYGIVQTLGDVVTLFGG